MFTLSSLFVFMLLTVSAAGIAIDLGGAAGLDDQAAAYHRFADAYADYIDELHANKGIDEATYVNEMYRARRMRRAYINQGDIAAEMAGDRRVSALQSALTEAVLAANPGRQLVGAGGTSAKMIDFSLNAYSTRKTALGIVQAFEIAGEVDDLERDLAARLDQILRMTDDELVRAEIGIRMNRAYFQYSELMERFPDNPEEVRRQFSVELAKTADRIKYHAPDLVGTNRYFESRAALVSYIQDYVDERMLSDLLPEPDVEPPEFRAARSPCPELGDRCRHLINRGALELTEAEQAEHAACWKKVEEIKACRKRQESDTTR